MIRQRKALLAGVAALALVAGAGFAAAQEGAKEKATQGTQGKPVAAQSMNKAPETTKTPEAGKMGAVQDEKRAPETRNAEEKNRNAAERPSQRAEEMNRTNKTDKKDEMNRADKPDANKMNRADKPDANKADKAAESRDHRKPEAATAQHDRKGMEGLQGNASGVNIKLTDEQRSRIRTTVIGASGAPRVTSVNFDITVGTVVPRGNVEIVPVSDTLVQIEPAWRGYSYFIYEEEIVIVSPDDMRIVAVVAV
jgi:hypothetical protein